jgi:hypothetical protein
MNSSVLSAEYGSGKNTAKNFKSNFVILDGSNYLNEALKFFVVFNYYTIFFVEDFVLNLCESILHDPHKFNRAF